MPEQFDLFGGRLDRDAGLASIARNNEEWRRGAFLVIHKLPRGWIGLTEDIRVLIEPLYGRPNHDNAYGELIREAVERGLLVWTGRLRQCRRRDSRARQTKEYRRT